MAKPIHEIIPDPEALLRLEPEEVGGIVLEYLKSLNPGDGQLNRYNFNLPDTVQGYPPQYQQRVTAALMEGWMWLERELLIAPRPGATGDWVIITRRGEQIKSAADLAAFRQASAQPATPPLDDLLPLYRRSAFDADLVSMAETATDTEPLALAMIDVDHFKRFNDEHGHQTGDEVLRAVAEAIRSCVSLKGRAYRYGGEELAILLPNYTIDEAVALAERVRKQIEATSVEPKKLTVSASVGVACLPLHTTDAAMLVEKADKAVYEAKNLGRNCVRVSGEPRPAEPTPRTVARKQPMPGALTEDEKRGIRAQYFRQKRAECPKDGAILEVHPLTSASRPQVALLVRCPMCGLQETIHPD